MQPVCICKSSWKLEGFPFGNLSVDSLRPKTLIIPLLIICAVVSSSINQIRYLSANKSEVFKNVFTCFFSSLFPSSWMSSSRWWLTGSTIPRSWRTLKSMESNSLRMNITRDYVEGIFQQHNCFSVFTRSDLDGIRKKIIKKKTISSIDGCTRVNT